MRSRQRVAHALGLFALLLSALAIPSATTAQEASCADYSSTAAAQFALDINPALAPSLDPDGNGVACDHEGSTTTTAPTSESLQLPTDETPTATTQQPVGTVDAVDQQPTTGTTTQTTPTTQQQAGTLDGRVGAMRPAFEAVHGAPIEEIPSDTNPSITGRVYTPPAGAIDLFVVYWNDQAAIVVLTAGDTPWSTDDASAQIAPYVPADVTTLPQPELLADGTYLLPVFSQTLSTGVTAAMLSEAGLPGVPGDLYILLFVDSANLVTEIEIGLGNGDNIRADAASGGTTTPAPSGLEVTTPTSAAANPTPTTAAGATTTTTDPTTFLQQARAEVEQYRAEIAELRQIINAGTFTEAETSRLSEIIVSWMAIDTTPLNAPPEHQQIATLLQDIHSDLSSVGMTLFTVLATGDSASTQQAADVLTRVESNLDLLDQQLIALGL